MREGGREGGREGKKEEGREGGRELTFEAPVSKLVVLLLLEPCVLEQGVGGMLEGGDRVGGRRTGGSVWTAEGAVTVEGWTIWRGREEGGERGEGEEEEKGGKREEK